MTTTNRTADVVGVAPKKVNRDDSSNPFGGHGNAQKSGTPGAHGNTQMSGTPNNRGSNVDPNA